MIVIAEWLLFALNRELCTLTLFTIRTSNSTSPGHRNKARDRFALPAPTDSWKVNHLSNLNNNFNMFITLWKRNCFRGEIESLIFLSVTFKWFILSYRIFQFLGLFFGALALMCLIYDFSFLINKQWKIIRWSDSFFVSTNVVKRGYGLNKCTRTTMRGEGEERKINLLFSLFDVLIRSLIVIIKWTNKLKAYTGPQDQIKKS